MDETRQPKPDESDPGRNYNGVRITQLPRDFYLASVTDVEGILALSEIMEITVQR